MKKVFQTRFGRPGGNCYQAAMASILEKELDEVPDFCNLYEEDWKIEASKWLHQFGLGVLTIQPTEWEYLSQCLMDGIFLVCGLSEEGVNHCVVWQKGNVIHDPHKNGTKINKIDTIDLIFPIDPARCVCNNL
jgi:hypothetical protein